MRLTCFLFKYKPEYIGPIVKFPGNVLTGKHRYVPKLTTFTKLRIWKELHREQMVIKYLSKPFITEEQEEAYLKSVGRTHPEFWDEFMLKPIERPLEQHYAADYLKKFDCSRQYEVEEDRIDRGVIERHRFT